MKHFLSSAPQGFLTNKRSGSGIFACLSAFLPIFLPVFFSLGLPLGQAYAQADQIGVSDTVLSIEQGKGTLIRLSRPATEVFIANPDIADVQVKSPRLIYIFGVSRGETSFFALDDDDQTIYAAMVDVTQNLASLKKAVAQMVPNSRIEISTVGNMIILEGRVESPDDADMIARLATSVGGNAQIMNRLEIMQPTQVNLRVRFAEVSRSILKELGVNLESFGFNNDFLFGLTRGRDVFTDVFDPVPARIFNPGAAGAGALSGSFRSGNFDLNAAIDALNSEGFVSVLAEPNLTALTGETASFLAGGEFPIPIPSRDGLGIEFREFGIRLDFTPTVLNSGSISMRVRPEVSDLSDVGAIQIASISIPSIVTRRAETTIELGSGQSFAIAGLMKNDISQSANKFPGLGDLPIIGALFRSDQFERSETELVIVVTPYIVRPVSDRQLSLPTDGYIAPSDMDRFLKGRRFQPVARPVKSPGLEKEPIAGGRAGFRLD